MRTPALIGLLACLAAGCAAFKPRPADPGLFLLAPLDAQVELTVTQQLKFSKGGQHFETLAVIELSREMLSMAALGPLGNRMLALRWDGKTLEQERDPSLPADLPLQLILRDLQLALWPAESVQAAIKAKFWSLEDLGSKRILSKNGMEVVRITFGSGDRWHSTILFEHLTLGYRLEIQPLKD